MLRFEPKTPSALLDSPRRGVAMFVVLGTILLVTLLGFAGLALSKADVSDAGTVLDMKSRDQAAWAGLNVALARMQSNPTTTAAQLSLFLQDVAANVAETDRRDQFSFTATGFTLQPASSPPDWFPIVDSATAANDESAVRTRILSLDVGALDPLGLVQNNGIVVTLQSIGRGRNGHTQTVVGSYRMLGITLSQAVNPVLAATITNAMYLSGNLENTNIGNNFQGDVYVGGSVSLNAGASQTVNGRFRVNGSFSSNATLTVTQNSWIGGSITTNSGAPMTFQENLGIGMGFKQMNAPLTVGKSLNVYGDTALGSWNGGATLRVGRQFFLRNQHAQIQGKVVVGGNAFLWNSLYLRGSVSDSFHGYTEIRGNTHDNLIQDSLRWFGGDLNMLTPRPIRVENVSLLDAAENAYFGGAVNVVNGNGQIRVGTSATFNSGIAGISPSRSDAIRIGEAMYLNAVAQNSFNGGVSVRNLLQMKGSLDASFSQNAGNSQWSLDSTGSRTWSYQGTAVAGGQDPRVRNSLLNNTDAKDALASAIPSIIVPPAGQPYGLTNAYIGMTAIDTMTSLSANPPDTFVVSATKSPSVDSAKVRVTAALCAAATASSDNWTAADFNKVYAYLSSQDKLLNGYMVLLIDSLASVGNFNAPGGTFTGKAVFIIAKSITVNGNWPASATSSAIQVVYVRGSGAMSGFGSPGDIYGMIYYENNPGSVTQQWGTGSKLYGSMQFANGGSYTGNTGSLTIALDQNVFADISTNLPGSLRAANGANGAPALQIQTNPTQLQAVNGASTRIQFLRLNEFR